MIGFDVSFSLYAIPVMPDCHGQRVRPVGVERRALLDVDEVGRRSGSSPCRARAPSSSLDHQAGIPRVVGHDDDLAVDPVALRERPLRSSRSTSSFDVDLLEVLDRDPGLLRELLAASATSSSSRRCRCRAASSRSAASSDEPPVDLCLHRHRRRTRRGAPGGSGSSTPAAPRPHELTTGHPIESFDALLSSHDERRLRCPRHASRRSRVPGSTPPPRRSGGTR